MIRIFIVAIAVWGTYHFFARFPAFHHTVGTTEVNSTWLVVLTVVVGLVTFKITK